MQRLIADMKAGQFKQVYLLYGDETYLLRQYRDKLKRAALAGGDSMNLNQFEGKGVSIPAMIDMAETLPFFAERRVVLVEQTELFKSGGDQLAQYLENPSSSTCFIFVERTVDKRSKLYKTIAKQGTIVEFARQDEKTLKKWVLSILKRENKQITVQTMELFLEKTGDDMENIHKELEKLICYCLDRDVITDADVEAICTHQIQNRIFDMIHAISTKNQQKALQLYYDLLALREPPMRILALLTRQFNMLLQVKELVKKGNGQYIIAEKMNLKPFIVGKYMTQASGFSVDYLKQALKDCAEADYAVKSGKMADQLSVELLIVNYSKT